MIYGKFAPFIHTDRTVSYMELSFLIALLPCVCYAIFKYGIRALMLILSCVLMNVLCAMLFSKSKKIRIKRTYLHNVISGVLFSLMLPPDTSLLIPITASVFMTFATEVLFGGIAFCQVNSPVLARILVEVVWGERLKGFSEGSNHWFAIKSLFSFARTTSSVASRVEDYHTAELITDGYPSYIGMCSVIMILIGTIYLLRSRTVRTAAPICYLVTVIIIRVSMHIKDGVRSNIAFLLISGIFFVAFFLLTDRATVPQNHLGGTVTGIICGILTAGAFEISGGITALCVPVVMVNIISGLVEYFTSDASERHAAVREEAQ